MSLPPVTLVLDRSALLAYAAGSMHVAEPLHEVTDTGTRYGVPVVAVVEVLAVIPGAERATLDWLLSQPSCVVLPTWGEDWQELSYWQGVTGRLDCAAALLAAFEHDACVLSSDKKAYGTDATLPVIYFPA